MRSAVLFLLLMSGAPAAQEPASAPLNVLWIVAEDMGPELGCYGTAEARTPQLDRLAREGVRFRTAFSTAPVCSSSRSAFMTGVDAHRIGAHHHRSHRDDGQALPEGVRLLTDWLRPAGYFTANLVDLTDDPDEREFRGTGKTDWNFHHEGPPFDGSRWSELAGHQPFFAQVNFPETHRGGAWNRAQLGLAQPADPERVELPPYEPDHPTVRADRAQYLNTVMALDAKVGRVLEQLERDGLAESTVVIFFGDHGRATVRGKQWPYDSGLRVPLIVRWPAGREPEGLVPGTVDERLVTLLDVSATTLAIGGLKRPASVEGRVLFGAAREPARELVFGGRDRGDETELRVRTVRDRRYRYLRNAFPERPFLQLNRYKETFYPVIGVLRELEARGELTPPQARLLAPRRPAEELYDLASDPWETVNLAGSPAHRGVLVRLRSELDGWLEELGPVASAPEPREVPWAWEQRMEANYGERLRQRAAQSTETFEPALLQGAWAGEVSTRGVRLQTHLTAARRSETGEVPGASGGARFELDLDPTFPAPRRSAWNAARPERDPVVGLALDELEPGRRYYWRAVYGPDERQVRFGPVGTFRTLPGRERARRVSFVVAAPGSGDGARDPLGAPALRSMLDLAPDFAVLGAGELPAGPRRVELLRHVPIYEGPGPRRLRVARDLELAWPASGGWLERGPESADATFLVGISSADGVRTRPGERGLFLVRTDRDGRDGRSLGADAAGVEVFSCGPLEASGDSRPVGGFLHVVVEPERAGRAARIRFELRDELGRIELELVREAERR